MARKAVQFVIDPDSGEPVQGLRFHKKTGIYYRIKDDKKSRHYYPKRGLKNLAYQRRAIFEHRCHLDGREIDETVVIDNPKSAYNSFGQDVTDYNPDSLVINPDDIAAYVREQLTNPETRSEFAALVGIPELAYLDRLRPSEISATLDSIRDQYFKKRKKQITTTCYRDGLRFWNEFAEIVSVDKVSEITTDHVRSYLESGYAAYQTGKSPTYVSNRFATIKTIFNHALKQQLDTENVSRVIQFLKMLEAPTKKNRVNLHVVEPRDFKLLLEKADARMRAILLLSLNAAFLPVDVIRIQKDSVDWKTGYLRDIRTKTGIPRIACLWKRTTTALKAYLKEFPHDHPEIFVSEYGEPMQLANQVAKRFNKLREISGVDKSVKFAHLRKSSETAAILGGADSLHVDMLMGHSATGVKDNYLLRKPEMVRDACAAIEAHYFPEPV